MRSDAKGYCQGAGARRAAHAAACVGGRRATPILALALDVVINKAKWRHLWAPTPRRATSALRTHLIFSACFSCFSVSRPAAIISRQSTSTMAARAGRGQGGLRPGSGRPAAREGVLALALVEFEV